MGLTKKNIVEAIEVIRAANVCPECKKSAESDPTAVYVGESLDTLRRYHGGCAKVILLRNTVGE